MYCDRCGNQVGEAASFCPNCGKQLKPPAVARTAAGRVNGHLKILAILWIAASVLRLVPGLFVMAIGSHRLWFLPPEVPPFVPMMMHALLPVIGGFLFLIGAIGVAAGWGLLNHQSWARPLALVLGVLSLIHFPLGTALGIYTLWVLWPDASQREYDSLSHA